MSEPVKKWARIAGEDRVAFQEEVVEMYVQEELSLRQIVERTGRSYGAVHKLLRDAKVTMRPRGNPTHL